MRKRLLLIVSSILFCWCGYTYGQLTAPFTETFSGSGLPTGWSNTTFPSSTSSNAFWEFSGSMGYDAAAAGSSNNNFTYADGSSPAQQRVELTTDSINISGLTAPELTFLFYSYNVTYAASGYNTLFVDFYDGSTWHDSIWGYSGSSSSSVWQFANVDLSTYTISGNVLVRFVVDQTTASTAFYNDIALDDISVANAPPCPRPTNFSAANVTSSTVDLSWGASTGASSYEVIYGASGFDPATSGSTSTSTTTTLNLTGLSGATNYEAYLIADCGSTNGLSDTVGPIGFTTLCVPFTASYSNNFDSETDGDVALCWEQYNNYSTSAYARVENQGSPRSGTQQLAMYNYFGFNPSDTLVAVTPEFSDMTVGDKQIRFHVKASDITAQLFVGTMASQNTSDTVTIVDTISFSTTNTYQEVILPLTTANGYNGTDDHVVFVYDLTNAGTFDYIYIDDFFYEVIPTCPKVSNLTLDYYTSSSATIGFTTTGTAVQYELGLAGFTQGTNAAAIVSATGNPITVSGLPSDTEFDIYIRNDCGSGDTSVWEGPLTFKTACAPLSAPYVNGFENDPLDVPPPCWTSIATRNFSWVEVEDFTGTSAPYAGSQALYIYGYNASPTSDTVAAISPQFSDMTAGDKRIKFFANSDDPTSELIIATTASPFGDSTFNVLDTINFPTPDTYQQVVVNIDSANGYNGTDQYIVLWHSLGGTFDYIRIDDFEYENQPSCLPPLAASIGAFNIGINSADIYWGAGSQGVKTFVEVGLTGFAPGTGGAIATADVAGSVDTATNVGTLTAQTTYEVYIRDSCAASGFSPWVGPFTFSTLCNVFAAPFSEDFDGTSWTSGSGFNNSGFTIDPCWSTNPDENASAVFKWGPRGSAPGSGNGPTTDVTGGNFIYVETSGSSAGNVATLVTPAIDLGALVYPALYFDEHRNSNGSNIADMTVEVSNDFGATWNTVYSVVGQVQTSSSAPWETRYVNLDTYIGDTIQVRFTQDGNGCCGDAAIDLVEVKNGPACPDPAMLGVLGLSDTAATLNWSGANSAVNYKVWFGPQGFFQGSQTFPGDGIQTTTTSDSLLVDTLTQNTCYEFVVRQYCSATDSTDWIGPFSFCTPCSPVFAPYTENFDGTTAPAVNPCWTVINNGSSTSSFVGTETFVNNSAPNSVEMYYFTGSGELALVTPLLGDFDSLKRVRFNVWDDDFTSDLIVGTMSNPADANTFTPYDTITAAEMPDQQWQEFRVFFGDYQGNDKYVAFLHGNNNILDQIYIDDFIYEEPTCFDPTNLQFVSNTNNSITISWTTGGASNWQVEYGPTGYTPGTGTVVNASTSTNFVLTGLTSGTAYDIYVRDSCGVGNVGLWTGALSAYTTCSPLSGTYTIGATGNYPTFQAAADALGICGVSGPVTFNVQAGYYLDRFHIQGIPGVSRGIPGASATNTVTINGSGSDTLEWDGIGTQAAVWLDSVSHITINNLYVVNNAPTEGWGILLTDNSDFVNITNNTVIVDSSGVFASDISPFVVSGSTDNDQTFGAEVNDLTVTGNTFLGGYIGASIYGESFSIKNENLIFNDNTIRNFYLSGLYIYSYDSVEIRGNTVISTVSSTDEDGMYLLDLENFQVEENYVYVKDWAIYMLDGNDQVNDTTQSTIVNNMFISENDYGMYLNDVEETDIFHNSSVGGPGIYLISPSNQSIRNNIFVGEGDYAFESSSNLPSSVDVDYNLYFNASSSYFEIGSTVYADLAAWQAGDASRNANSVGGDPVFASSTDLHLIGGLANDVGDGTLGVTVDIDGDTRPATGAAGVDIGADEYTPVPGDFDLFDGEFTKLGPCYRTNDTISLFVRNIVGGSVDLSVDSIVATYSVTGPVNSSGTIVVNSGTFDVNDTLTLRATNIDLSIPGEYTLNAYIDTNSVNVLPLNDTLAFNSVTITVDSILTVSPKSHNFLSSNDTITIVANSPFFGGNTFFITEICHFAGSSNGAAVPRPSYLTADDYIEVTGVPGSDMEGVTLEQWSGSSLLSSYTFPKGTIISPNGTAVIAVGQLGSSTPSPENYYYHGTGSFTGSSSSGGPAGRILKDANGNIMDAVGYSGGSSYTFPAAAGVSASDWSGNPPTSSGSWGIRLEGVDDNTATNWVASATSIQDPNILNNNVTIPAPVAIPGFSWSLNGTTTTTAAVDTIAASTLAPGTYNYIATFVSPCGIVYTDTVVITVPACSAPANFRVAAATQSSLTFAWDTVGVGSNLNFQIEYGAVGHTPGSGTITTITADTTGSVSGLTANLCQEFYIRTDCGGGTFGGWLGPIKGCPAPTPCDDFEVYATGSMADQSSLVIEWLGNGGDGEISTTQAQSGTQSLRIYDSGPAGQSDYVAYFDTISSGIWDVEFSMYVVNGSGAYYNIQQNHVPAGVSGTNIWAFDVYFQANGTAQVEYGNPATNVGSFSYAQGQWIDVKSVIDLDNDTVWIEINDSTTGVGWNYSSSSPATPLQFNGVNFYTGVYGTGTYGIDYYVDDFCVTPFGSACPTPNSPVAGAVDCDNFDVTYSTLDSALIQYGPTGFSLGTGSFSGVLSGSGSYNISGLTVNTSYDVYVANVCANGDTSAFAGPLTVVTTGPLPTASFTHTINNFTVDFDASASVGAGLTYDWDYGDGNNGTGVTSSHTYTTGGNYTVTLTVTNVCGTDDTIINIASVDLHEHPIARTLALYPNPTSNKVAISFEWAEANEADIRIVDVRGKEVMRRSLQKGSSTVVEYFDVSKLAAGVYSVEVRSGDFTANRKLIVQ